MSSNSYYRNLKVTSKIEKKNGKIVTTDREKKNNLKKLDVFPDDCVIKVEFSLYDEKLEKERIRTEQQNKYYHKLLDIICGHTGDTHMDLHTTLKCMFLSRPYVIGDKEYTIVGSTATLNSKNFSDYLERVFHWASSELDLTLPQP